jgi:hypothetical protein
VECAHLRRADLSGALLLGANLSGARLDGADLSGAFLADANLSGAELSHARMYGADLFGALLESAVCSQTYWARLDLSPARGLANIVHKSPSSVDIDTILMSGGNIPDAFLRGCGVPKSIIAQQKALARSVARIQFYSCFISHSHGDEAFARQLHVRLQEEGLRVWYAPEEMKAGRKLREQIDEAIMLHDKLLLVLSEASMASKWVETEIRKARKRERKEGRQVFFPIGLVAFKPSIRDWECFDSDNGEDLASAVREYHIPDFSRWKDHEAFEAAVGRLLKDLTASAEPPRVKA